MKPVTVVFFDGVCNLCNGFVDRVIRLDKSETIRFASLQGQAAKQLLGAEADALASIVVVRDGDVYRESDGVIQVALALGGIHAFGARLAALLPLRLRNWVYRFIAKRRYQFFGQRGTCRVPTIAERSRFLE